MPDTFESLMRERRAMRDTLADWWARWDAVYRQEIGDGDPAAAVYPIDVWAREAPAETAKRWVSTRAASLEAVE